MSVYNIIELINLGLALVLLLIGVRIPIMFKDVNPELLKAKMFLKKGLIKKMWIYSTAAGGLFLVHEIAMASEHFSYVKGVSEITMTAFIVPFILLTYTWYSLLRESIGK